MGQCRRSFEVVDSPWRVRDKYAVVQDSSIPPPLSADDLITLEVFTSKVRARSVCLQSANRLKCKLGLGRLASTENAISLLHDFHSAPLSRQAVPGSVQSRGAPLDRRDAMDAEADQALSAEGRSLKGGEFEYSLPRPFLHTAISRFARGRRRFNAETRRVAEIRREFFFSALLCTAIVGVDRRRRRISGRR
jgi:hypothetical protein